MKKFIKITAIVIVVIFIILVIDDVLESDSDENASAGNEVSASTSNEVPASTRESIRIVNNTGSVIYTINVSPSSTDNWGRDLLGIFSTLGDSEFVYQLPHPISIENRYDIKLINSQDDEFIKWRVAVSDNAQIVFTSADMIRVETYTPPVTQQPVQTAQQPAQTTQPTQQGTSTTPQQPASTTTPQSTDVNAIRTAVVNAAQRYLGASYVLGAQTPPTRFDCSGLINQAFRDGANIVIPRSSAEMWSRGTRISRNQLQPGDIIVYSSNGGRTTTHVSMVMNSNEMIHAVSAGTPRGVIRQNQSSGSWPGQEIGYVRFIGVPVAVTRNTSKDMALTELLMDITSSLMRNTEELPVMAGSVLSFVMTNRTGRDDQFDLYFYKIGSPRSNGETDFLFISNGDIEESKAFICEESGQYRLEIVRRSDNRTLVEYTYNVEA